MTYTEEEITDNVYLIFYRSGNTIGDVKVNMFSFDYMYNYSIENLVGIAIG